MSQAASNTAPPPHRTLPSYAGSLDNFPLMRRANFNYSIKLYQFHINGAFLHVKIFYSQNLASRELSIDRFEGIL